MKPMTAALDEAAGQSTQSAATYFAVRAANAIIERHDPDYPASIEAYALTSIALSLAEDRSDHPAGSLTEMVASFMDSYRAAGFTDADVWKELRNPSR